MPIRYTIYFLLLFLTPLRTLSNSIFIPMDETQTNHLKAYGIAYWAIEQGVEVDWLLNYRGGSFMTDYFQRIENELVIRGVSYHIISDAEQNRIITEISDPSSNTDAMKLEKAPKIAVYSPKSALPWDDAVTLVLTYAEIPYDVVFDDSLDDRVYCQPLTLEIAFPDSIGIDKVLIVSPDSVATAAKAAGKRFRFDCVPDGATRRLNAILAPRDTSSVSVERQQN